MRPTQSVKKHFSTQILNTNPASPPPSSPYSFQNTSPSSSGGASSLTPSGQPQAYSSASSSTLTAGSDVLNKSGRLSSHHLQSN